MNTKILPLDETRDIAQRVVDAHGVLHSPDDGMYLVEKGGAVRSIDDSVVSSLALHLVSTASGWDAQAERLKARDEQLEAARQNAKRTMEKLEAFIETNYSASVDDTKLIDGLTAAIGMCVLYVESMPDHVRLGIQRIVARSADRVAMQIELDEEFERRRSQGEG